MIVARRAWPLLGTRVAATAWGEERRGLLAALGAALEEVARVHALLSFHDPASELSHLHRTAFAAPQAVDRRTYRVLELAVRLWRETGGAFEPTTARQSVAEGRLPEPIGAPRTDRQATMEDVLLLPAGLVAFRRPLWLDLGGLAKGYAVDRAVNRLRRDGVRTGMVDAGGDLRVFGERPVKVALRHPADPSRRIAIVELRNRALASSASSPRVETEGWTRLISPAGARLAAGRGATVIARRCAVADAWTKGALFAPEVAVRALPRIGGSALLLAGDRVEWLGDPPVEVA